MVIDLNDTYRMMMMTMIMIIMMVKTQNSHNLTNFEATTFKFCMVIKPANSDIYAKSKFGIQNSKTESELNSEIRFIRIRTRFGKF